MVLELAKGGELFDYLASGGALSERFARYYFRQLIEGLSHMHQNGIVHRDIKLQNLLLNDKL